MYCGVCVCVHLILHLWALLLFGWICICVPVRRCVWFCVLRSDSLHGRIKHVFMCVCAHVLPSLWGPSFRPWNWRHFGMIIARDFKGPENLFYLLWVMEPYMNQNFCQIRLYFCLGSSHRATNQNVTVLETESDDCRWVVWLLSLKSDQTTPPQCWWSRSVECLTWKE